MCLNSEEHGRTTLQEVAGLPAGRAPSVSGTGQSQSCRTLCDKRVGHDISRPRSHGPQCGFSTELVGRLMGHSAPSEGHWVETNHTLPPFSCMCEELRACKNNSTRRCCASHRPSRRTSTNGMRGESGMIPKVMPAHYLCWNSSAHRPWNSSAHRPLQQLRATGPVKSIYTAGQMCRHWNASPGSRDLKADLPPSQIQHLSAGVGPSDWPLPPAMCLITSYYHRRTLSAPPSHVIKHVAPASSKLHGKEVALHDRHRPSGDRLSESSRRMPGCHTVVKVSANSNA